MDPEPYGAAVNAVANEDDETGSDGELELIHGMRSQDLERWHDPDPHPYRLVPECRVCYALFANSADLAAHLRARPAHNRRFRFKRRNELAAGVNSIGHRTCRTCALSFGTPDDWENHNEQT